ncbi:hypothetical protein KI387_027675, partial [Taxus chinensis]
LLPCPSKITGVSPVCCSTRSATVHTPGRTQREREEGEVMPAKEMEDPDSGFTM